MSQYSKEAGISKSANVNNNKDSQDKNNTLKRNHWDRASGFRGQTINYWTKNKTHRSAYDSPPGKVGRNLDQKPGEAKK